MPQVWFSSEAREWTERADRYASPHTPERVWADLYLGLVKLFTGRGHEGVSLMSRGLDLAREICNPDDFLYVAGVWGYNVLAPQHSRKRFHLAEEMVALPRTGISLRSLVYGMGVVGNVFEDWGKLQQAKEAFQVVRQIAEKSGHVITVALSAMEDAQNAVMEGLLEKAEQIAQEGLLRGEETGLVELAGTWTYVEGFRTWLLLGKPEEALQFVKKRHPAAASEALCLAYLDRKTEVVDILEKHVMNRPNIGTVDDETSSNEDILYLDAAILIQDEEAAKLLFARFTDDSSPFLNYGPLTCVSRHLGGAAALLGKYDEARQYYQEAIKVCTEMPFRPELALSKLQFAELLLEHYPDEKKEALEHLDFAIKEFRDMKMQPSLERALRHKDILKA